MQLFAFSGERMTRVLNAIAELRGYPKTIVMDDGSEMVSSTMLRSAVDRRVQPHHIAPGKPFQKAFIGCFNGRLRDECLNGHDFTTLFEARLSWLIGAIDTMRSERTRFWIGKRQKNSPPPARLPKNTKTSTSY
jgi:transposase InsO family protein